MIKRLGAVLLAVACVFAFAAPAGGARTRVRAGGSPGAWEWQPDFKHITKGTVVVWKNPTATTHRVTAYSSNWSKNSELPSGEATRKRFRKRGAYLYRCTVPGHSSVASGDCQGMCGQIHVTR